MTPETKVCPSCGTSIAHMTAMVGKPPSWCLRDIYGALSEPNQFTHHYDLPTPFSYENVYTIATRIRRTA